MSQPIKIALATAQTSDRLMITLSERLQSSGFEVLHPVG